MRMQREEEQDVESRDNDRPEEGDMEQQVERDRAPQDFCQVARADGCFAHQPVGPAGPARVPVATALSKVFPCHHTQPGGNDLHEDRHQAGNADDPQKIVFEPGAPEQVGPPVTRIHITNADKHRRTDERPPLPPEAGFKGGHANAAVHPFKRQVSCGRRFGSDGSGEVPPLREAGPVSFSRGSSHLKFITHAPARSDFTDPGSFVDILCASMRNSRATAGRAGDYM
jgi:hypothetical protein